MESDADNQKQNDKKSELRVIAIKKLFKNKTQNLIKEPIIKFFTSLIEFTDALDQTFKEIKNVRSVKLLNKLLPIILAKMEKIYSQYSSEQQKNAIESIFNSIESNFPPSYSKVEPEAIVLFLVSAKICQLFPEQLSAKVCALPQNPNFCAFQMIAVSTISNFDSEIFGPIFTSKQSNTLITFAIYVYVSKHPMIEKSPMIKFYINSFKSVSDDTLFALLSKDVIACILQKLDASNVKELRDFLSYAPRRLRKDPASAVLFVELIDRALDFPDGSAIIKPFTEDILSVFLMTIKAQNLRDDEEVEDVSSLFNNSIGEAFVKFSAKIGINPLESYVPSKVEPHPVEAVILVNYLTRAVPSDQFNERLFDVLFHMVPAQIIKPSALLSLLLHIAYYYTIKFQSKKALKLLITGLNAGSVVSSKYILDSTVDYPSVFEEIASIFKPGSNSQLYIDTLASLIKQNLPSDTELVSESEKSERSDTGTNNPPTDSESNFDLIKLGSRPQGAEQEIVEGTPTAETILFGSTLTALDKHPELITLLPLVAATLSPAFSRALSLKFPTPGKHRFVLDSLPVFGTALQHLEVNTQYALAQTFLMLPPEESMLYFAITLERLPRRTAAALLQKTLPFACEHSDITARMVALVSYAHPDTAVAFIESLLQDSTAKRRYFLIFRTTEADEQTLVVVLKAIGHCATFIENSYFVSDFIPFATDFLNKHLAAPPKNAEVCEAALLAIKKLSQRIHEFQQSHSDHVFPFKDFLMQFACTYYLEAGDAIIGGLESARPNSIQSILGTISALLPLMPIRVSEKHEKVIEMTAGLVQVISPESFQVVFKGAKMFFGSLIDSIPSLNVFVSITLPMFPAMLMHSEWRQIAALMKGVCERWEKLNIAESTDQLSKTINDIGTLTTYALPLLVSDSGSIAADIISALVSLNCAIRNQILSLPRSIRPSIGDAAMTQTGAELVSSVCAFISKPLLTPQIFDIILMLIDLYQGNKVLPEHHLGIALAIDQLILQRGSEEFRVDSKIVGGICQAIDGKTPEVVDVLLRVLGQLFKMRLFSVLSGLMGQETVLSDEVFKAIIEQIRSVKKGGAQLLQEVARSLACDEPNQPSVAFSVRALPILAEDIAEATDEVWAKLVIGVIRTNETNRFKLLSALAGSEVKNIVEFADFTGEKRKGALQFIAVSFNTVTNDISYLLAFAAVGDSTCSAFLGPALPMIAKLRETPIDALGRIFKMRSGSAFSSFSAQINSLLLSLAPMAGIECAANYLSKCAPEQADGYWSELSGRCAAMPSQWLGTLAAICELTKPQLRSMVAVMPLIAVTTENEDSVRILRTAAAVVGCTEEDPFKMGIAILGSGPFTHNRREFMQKLISYLDVKEYALKAWCALLVLCEEVNDQNLFAVEAVVEKMPIVVNGDCTSEINKLLDVLK